VSRPLPIGNAGFFYFTSMQAVLMPKWIGDFIMALAVVKQRSDWNKNNLCLIVPTNLTQLASELCDYPLICFSPKSVRGCLRFRGQIRARKITFVYILPKSFSAALFAFLGGIAYRRGRTTDRRAFLLTPAERISGKLRDKTKHIVNEYAHILNTPVGPIDKLFVEESQSTPPPDEPYVVVCPGAKYGPAKKWPYFADLVRSMADTKFVVLGSAEDATTGAEIQSCSPQRVENIAGKTSLKEAITVLRQAACVVSNDSGLMHLAAALNRPVIGVFGSTSARWTHPLGARSIALSATVPCSPCFKRTCIYGHYDCLHQIKPEAVSRAIEELIRGKKVKN